jgi:dienelactone hydrolase
MRIAVCLPFVLALAGASLRADGPADNRPENVRRIPKLGIEVSQEQRDSLENGLEKLQQAIRQLAGKKDARTSDLLPDVEIFYKAVHDALTYQEFFDSKDVRAAESLLTEGLLRAQQLAAGQAPWTTQTGLVVRGYRSRIDQSVQPYGLVIPASLATVSPQMQPPGHRWRLDLWFHGRGETLSEVNFIDQRRKQVGTFAPADAIVLHPYGRYSNAFKLAGEVDVLEALESVQKRYAIDPDRISARGFSMGGAACWQFAVHYPDRWFAANPGAGFSETPEFLKSFQQETLNPPWYERQLWNMYDCPGYAVNLSNCPTIAYSGEIDRQKQAADVMEAALEREGIDLVHIIGPKTAHAYHPQARAEVESLMAALAQRGRNPTPRHVHLATYTLKYNRQGWVTIDALGEHWQPARVDGEVTQGGKIRVKSDNITALTLHFPTGSFPLDLTAPPELTIDGQKVEGPAPRSDRSWKCQLMRDGSTWKAVTDKPQRLRKRHDLQGPIDDAFMDSFIFVRPSGTPLAEATGKWVDAELTRAIEHWRRHFRGDARVKKDSEITDEDIATANLVLWGDVHSNALIARINDKLPVRFDGQQIVAGQRRFAVAEHAPILIYPNPLNPDRYVVLNSSFTFREYDYLNNARQTPKLPDWAVVDVRTPPDSRWPGKIVDADFFDEAWRLKPPHDQRRAAGQ